jgi:uncharacterized membrane protein (UPF0127 family)
MCISRILFRFVTFRKRKVKICGKIFSLEIADTFVKQMLGLMHRESIGKREGMLFVFGRDGMNSIWMANMNFPIDIIWLDADGIVVGIEEMAAPCRNIFNCRAYSPSKESRYVIELKGGVASSIGIRKGVAVRI